MQILLTGGTGFIGSALGDKLAKEGYSVSLLGRNPRQAQALKWVSKFYFWRAGMDKVPMESIPKGDWACINLCGESVFSWPWTSRTKKRIYNSRIQAARTLVEASCKLDNPPKFFLQASALGIYGDETNSKDLFLQKVCRDLEKELDLLPPSVSKIIFRFPYVLSSAGGLLKEQMRFLKYKVYLDLKSRPELQLPWIHREDLINIFLKALSSGDMQGVYDISSPNPTTFKEISQKLLSSQGFVLKIPVPLFLLKFLGGEMFENLFMSHSPKPEKLLSSGYVFKHPRLSQNLASWL